MKNLTTGNIWRTFLIFALPLLFSTILSQAYSTVDLLIAGQFIEETEGLSAIGSTEPYTTFLSAVFWGWCSGFSIYVARLFGAGQFSKMRQAILNNVFFTFALALVLGVVSVVFRDPIFDILNIDAGIRDACFSYFAVYMLGFPFLALGWNGVYLSNALGMSGVPLMMQVASAIMNIGGNILAVTVLDLGVMGLALSSVISAAVVVVGYGLVLRRTFRELSVAGEKFNPSPRAVAEGAPYAGPNTFQQLVMYFASLALSPTVNLIGPAATAAYSVVHKLYDVNSGIFQSTSKTFANFGAQSIGAGKVDQLPRGFRVAFVLGVVFLTPVVLVCAIFPEAVCSLFFKTGETSEAIAYAVEFATKFLPFIYLALVGNLFHNLFRCTKRMFLLTASTLVGSVSRIVLSLILTAHYGMTGFYLGWVLSWAMEAALCLVFYLTGIWKKGFEINPSET